MPTAQVLHQVNLHLLDGMLTLLLHGDKINNGAALGGLQDGKLHRAAQQTPKQKEKVKTKERIKIKLKQKTKLKAGRRKETSEIVFKAKISRT